MNDDGGRRRNPAPTGRQDRIQIRDLLLRGIIGIKDEERQKRQDILINLVLWSDLRPAGRALIDGKRYDVVSVGDFVATDSTVKVTEINGNRIVVRKVNS